MMEAIDRLHPGQRAVGFDRASSEMLALAQAFNGMLDRLETERRESSARALAAQEAERLRIARELHDEIGQTLTAVALRAEHAAGQGGPERRDLAELAEVVQQSLQDVRRISRELRPEALDELGLVNALIALCSRVTEQSGLRIHRRLEGGLPELSPEVELAIYRIAQEALTNAMRHSKATEATVSLSQRERRAGADGGGQRSGTARARDRRGRAHRDARAGDADRRRADNQLRSGRWRRRDAAPRLGRKT